MKRGREQELFDHQKNGVKTIVDAFRNGSIDGKAINSFLLCDEMGLGKTLQALETILCMDLQKPSCIVCPSSCVHIWTKDTRFDAFVYSRGAKLPKSANLIIVSYDLLLNMYKNYISSAFPHGGLSNKELIRFCNIYGKPVDAAVLRLTNDHLRRELLTHSRKIVAKHFPIQQRNVATDTAFMQMEWGVFVMDEIHKIRNVTSATTKAIGFVQSLYYIGLSGTPVVNSGNDLLCIWKFGLKLFHLDWSLINQNPNSDYCKRISKLISLGRTKEELAFPKRNKVEEDVVLEWTDPYQKQAYLNVKNNSIQEFENISAMQKNALETNAEFNTRKKTARMTFFSKMQKLRQICICQPLDEKKCTTIALLCLKEFIPLASIRKRIIRHYQPIRASPKMLYVKQLLSSHPTEKMVVFCTFRTFLEKQMSPWLSGLGIPHVIFCGNSRKEQQSALKSFEENPELRIILVVKTAGSEGLNLIAASICVIMDPHFNMALDEQASQRIDRIGQTNRVLIRKLYMKGSIDQAMHNLQKSKDKDARSWTETQDGGGLRSFKSQGLFLKQFDIVN